MKLTRRSSLEAVASEVARALTTAGIEAVLTGGACATLYSKGEYMSYDLDFILLSAVTRRQLDAAMKTIDFKRRANRYEHPAAQFFVEFPAGPLGIGADIAIQPVDYAIGKVKIKLLSPTDSCRDRLAAFYHWKDWQSLQTAVTIARYHKVGLETIREWSSREGASAAFTEFEQAVKKQKKARRLTIGTGKSRKRTRRT